MIKVSSRKSRFSPQSLFADRLHPWEIRGRYLALNRPGVTKYNVPLEDLSTPKGWAEWHRHLQSKRWAAADVFIGLETAAQLMGGAS